MVRVSSSNLVAAGYDPANRELTIQFHNGVYTYLGVPRSVYTGLLNAASKGSYHHRVIKKYPFRIGY